MGPLDSATSGTAPTTTAGHLDLEPHLSTATLARRVELHSVISSTNDRALTLARGGAEAGIVVVALSQTAGRGQRGHRWVSPPGAGVYASFLLRPRMPPRLAPALTLVAGVALRRALQPILPVPLGLRWPNDLLVRAPPDHGRKLAGILVEAAASTDKIEHAVVGVGVNLTRVPRSPDIDPFITSLEALGAEETRLAPVLGRIANALEAELTSAEREGLVPAAAAWSRHAIGLGETVLLYDGSTKHRGVLVGLAEDGALVLRTPAGDRPYYRGTLEIPGFRRPPRLG